jgi:hypothetical protein
MGVNLLPSGSVKEVGNIWFVPGLSNYGRFYYKNGKVAFSLNDFDIYYDEFGEWTFNNIKKFNSDNITFQSISSSNSIVFSLESGSIDALNFSGSFRGNGGDLTGITASFAISSSHSETASYFDGLIVSTSYAKTASKLDGLTDKYIVFGNNNGSYNQNSDFYFETVDGINYLILNNGLLAISDLSQGTTNLGGGSLILTPTGSSDIFEANPRYIRFGNDNGNSILIRNNSSSFDSYELVLPGSQGSSDTYLQNDGDGNLTWSNIVSSSYASTASYVKNAQTASYFSGSITSASYASTSSYAVYFDFANNLSPVPALLKGRMYYDRNSDSLNYYNSIREVHIGQDLLITAKNVTGATITSGSAVYISGVSGDNPKISLSVAHIHPFSNDINGINECIGLVTNDIAHTDSGYVMIRGVLERINTSGFSVGDTLWLSTTTSGSYTNILPSPPYDRIKIGIVTSSSVSGKIFVQTENSIHFNNISGVSGSLPPNDKDIWVYNSSSKYFYNTKSGLELSGSFSGSFQGSITSSSYALTSSYYQETDPVFNSVSGTFVTNSQTSSMTVLTSSYALTSSVVVDNTSSILIGRSASIAATTLFTTPPGGTGWYQVNWLLTVTRAAGTSCVLGPFQLRFTHGVDNVVKTWPAGNTNFVNQSNVNNTASGIISGYTTLYCSASSNIQYIVGYTSAGGLSMSYAANFKIKPI